MYGNRIVSELTNKDSIEKWRKAKEVLDSEAGYNARLGCVGEPIADAIDKVLPWFREDYREDAIRVFNAAAADARSNLLDYTNDARQAGADELISDIELVVQFDSYDIELDTSDTLADVAERGFDQAVSMITNLCWTVSEVTDEEL